MMLTGIALFVTAAMYAQGPRPAEKDLTGAKADDRSVESTAETDKAAHLAASGKVAARTDIARTALFGDKVVDMHTRSAPTSQQARLFDGIALPVAPVWRSNSGPSQQQATKGSPENQDTAASNTVALQDDESLIDANTGGTPAFEVR